MTNCANCKGNNFQPGEGAYNQYLQCVDCKMYKNEKVESKLNVILPDDPNDALLCEGCQ